MKIALSLLSGVGYGGLTYFRNLLPSLARVDVRNEYHVFLPQGSTFASLVQAGNFRRHECPAWVRSAPSRFLWEQVMLPRKLAQYGIDVMYTAKNIAVIGAPCRTVIAIRNMEPLCFSNYKNYWLLNVFSRLRRLLTMISIRRASAVVAVSGFVRDAVVAQFPAARHKLCVIYSGNPITGACVVPAAGSMASVPYLLSASKFVAYANQLNLVKGYAHLHSRREGMPPLWLAGGVLDRAYHRSVCEFVKSRRLEGKVVFLGLLPHDQLMELLSGAVAFLYPSTLEACPQTLIEAMAYGLPIATSNTAPMPEMCQDAAEYFDPADPKDIGDKIEAVVFNGTLRSRLRRQALARARFFQWDETAAHLVRLFENLHVAGAIPASAAS